MKQLLRKLVKYLVYSGTAVIILLAVAVGLFRLFLPRLPEYQEEIKEWASAAIGMQVEFSGMDARWRLRGPELNFHDAALVSRENGVTVLHAEEVRVGVGLMRLLRHRELVAERVLIRDSAVDVDRGPDGSWTVQGIPLGHLDDLPMSGADREGPLTVDGEDILLTYRDTGQTESLVLLVETLTFRRDELQQGFEASLVLPATLGDNVDVAATRRLVDSRTAAPWQVFIEGEDLNAAGLAGLAPAGWPRIASGMADLSFWLAVSDGSVRSATANFSLGAVVADEAAGREPFDAEGRFEYSRSDGGWIVAADEFTMSTAGGRWPKSSFQLRVGASAPGQDAAMTGRASWFNLDDLVYVAPWIPAEARARLETLGFSGVVRDVSFELGNGPPDARPFDLAATMVNFGMAPARGMPGIRGFSGSLRADNSGGRLEMAATGMQLDLAGHLPEPVELESAEGTVVWRHSDFGTTLLTNSIYLGNADFESTSSLQITLPQDDASPIVDLEGTFNISDIARVKRYLPPNAVKPGLYRWLADALVAGNLTGGSIQLSGPLERFPFDNGEGVFRAQGTVENATLLYSGQWPAAENLSAEVVVENARLWSHRNSALNAGNSVVNARIEIPDLRSPVLSIEGQATGTLDTVRRFSLESPVANVFGGHLERVSADGAASFDLMLTYPILDRENFDFTTRIRSEDGTVRVEGLPSPITGLRGEVTVSRDGIETEALSGSFFGGPVAIDLRRPDDPGSSYSVVATAQGKVEHEGLAEHLGALIPDMLNGATAYNAVVRFPRPGLDIPQPLAIEIESDLQGMALKLPVPLGKSAERRWPSSFAIELPAEGRIEASGNLGQDVRWTANFLHGDGGWDFDRGVLAVGGASPGEPETRGLHVQGSTPMLDFEEWLALARHQGEGPGYAERIRSIDIVVEDLHVIGQHLSRHRVVVNRSALDWAVRLDGEQAIGSLTIPYDFNSDRALTLDMQKLTLPGEDDPAASAAAGAQGELGPAVQETRPDPRTLPRITVSADDFSLGQRHFGRLSADFERTPAGLEAASIETNNDTFDIRGRAGWVVDESDDTGQRSYVAARLTSSNVARTLRSLDYDVGIESESMDARFDLSWSGGPGQDLLPSLDGTVSVRFGTGQLDEVEPGAGRVFGLMSIVALPRRLSLDFRDVFDRGFGFDEITGTFRLENGEAFTCDLSLKGPAADVGIAGRAGLLAKDYDQTAVVSANVGNTLPVVGAVVAGPQVAAALLIFSQIFKKPLQEMGQIYYSIDGDWQQPLIETANAQDFAETSALAGCLDGAA